MPEILLSNMALWPLAGLPLEYTGLIARSLGYDGVEHIPTKVGRRQLADGKIGPVARIKAAHVSWRSEPYGESGRKKVLEYRKTHGLQKTVAGLITIATLPLAEESEEYLTRLQTILGNKLPVILYSDKLADKHPSQMPFKEKSVQITTAALGHLGATSLPHLVDILHGLDVHPCYDTVHSHDLQDPIKAFVQTNSREVHIGVDRIDTQEDHGDTSELEDYLLAERFVVESAIPNFAKLARVAASLKNSLRS